MTEKKYKVIFCGEVVPGKNVRLVKENLAKAFKTDRKKIDALFSGKPQVIKKDASREVCEKTRQLFTSAGAVCSVVPQSDPQKAKRFDPSGIESDYESDGPVIDAAASPIPSGQVVTAPARINKTVLLLLTFFLGFLGIHKHYLGRSLQGVLYLLFCWTGIPTIIALVEFVLFAFTDEEALNDKYTPGSMALVIIMAVFSPLIALALITLSTAVIFYYVLANHGDAAATGFLNLLITDRTVAVRPIPTAPPARHGIVFPEKEPGEKEDTRIKPDPTGPTGIIKGNDFTAEKVVLQNGVLHLKQGNDFIADLEVIIFLFADGDNISGKTFKASLTIRSAATPHIHLSWKTDSGDTFRSEVVLGKYDMRLAFESVIERLGEKSVAGHIDLNIPGDKRTRVTGPFIATVKDRS